MVVAAIIVMATMALLAIVMATMITEKPVAPTSRDTLMTTVEFASTMTTTLGNAPGIIG